MASKFFVGVGHTLSHGGKLIHELTEVPTEVVAFLKQEASRFKELLEKGIVIERQIPENPPAVPPRPAVRAPASPLKQAASPQTLRQAPSAAQPPAPAAQPSADQTARPSGQQDAAAGALPETPAAGV